jgi:hypothetical protein
MSIRCQWFYRKLKVLPYLGELFITGETYFRLGLFLGFPSISLSNNFHMIDEGYRSEVAILTPFGKSLWFLKDSSWCIYLYGCYFLVGHWSSSFVPRFPILDGCLFLYYVWHGFIIIPKGPQKFKSPNKLKKVSMTLIIDNYLTLKQEWSCKKVFHFLVQFKLNLH